MKTETIQRGPPNLRAEDEEASPIDDQHVPAHKGFREKYFAGFNTKSADTP